MNVARRALWYVESHGRGALTLETVADACHVSPYHLTRAFAAETGWSLMRYVRARRLSEAARRLARGADDILGLALDAGYGSHEAFTRAFRDHFARTPEQLRARGDLTTLSLTEPLRMSATPTVAITPPRFESSAPLLLAGVGRQYACHDAAGIASAFSAIWSEWFPASAVRPAPGPTLERYGESFDPRTGLGGVEIWIPVEG